MPNTKRTQRLRGVCDRATKSLRRGSGDCAYGRTQHVQCRYARHCRSAGVQGHITRKRIASEAGRSRVWPSIVGLRRRSASGRRGAVADDERAREVGRRHSSWEADESGSIQRGAVRGGAIRCGAGGAKGGGQGEYGPAKHAPDTESGERVTSAGTYTASSKGKA